MKPFISTLTLVLGTAFATAALADGDVCMATGEMKAALIDWYGEAPVAEPSDAKEQLWVSQETGTWTLLKNFSDGNSCVLAQGDDWMTGTGQDQFLAQLQD
ncbi:S-adenosyl-L-homocysteine hydrolase [Sulfitobacter sp. F26204]|uniref:S-adenosyl-L-homocysteine hydrolase n=1 Tax=Sulfitobacter sp. F26204 TaxID=2996014 RepID=UPI00225E2C83|nr:S-adenosyl-L-homocysteine hydrolase [Sulfitobacter sp. F26204]MCX7558221.1 S-adenosyl-L-homocysteine hydrolase [Sulfitobacter sp. F26204]